MVPVEHIPTVHEGKTVGDLREVLHHNAHRYRVMDYVYVVNDDNKLLGVMSLRDVYSSLASDRVSAVCKNSSLSTIRAEAHQERAAYLALKHNIKAIPVVDGDHRLLGEISNDSILTILHKEMHEDVLRMAGISHSGGINANVLELTLFQSFRHRIPWLVIGLFGGLLAAKVIGAFEQTLQQNLVLAAFLPLIVYMSSAVGTQMQAYVIRDLAINHSLPFSKYLLRNAIVVLAISAALSVLLLVSSTLIHGDPVIGRALGVSLFVSTLSSIVTGLLLPYGFSRCRWDPADASGPIATIIQDMLSILIYFSVANALL